MAATLSTDKKYPSRIRKLTEVSTHSRIISNEIKINKERDGIVHIRKNNLSQEKA